MAVLLPEGKQNFTNSAGAPLVGGRVYTYDAGTNTPRLTYQDAAGTVPNTNPVILDARGDATIFWSGAYKVVLRDAADVIIWTVDNVSSLPDGGSAADLAARLANPNLLADGDAMIAVKQPLANSVARTQHDKNFDVVYTEDFRLPGDPDDTLSIQRGLNLGIAVGLRANKTYVASGLVAVAGSALVCPMGRATITVPAGANRIGLSIAVNNFTLQGVNFDGGNPGPYFSGSGAFGTRNGVLIGNPFGTGISLGGIKIADCDIYGFDVAGIQGREIQIGFNFGYKVTMHNVNCYNNLIGFWFSPRFEYVVLTACYGYKCYAGIIMQAGNNTVIGSHFEESFQNCQMSTGENDAHGQFVGCSFNHAFGAGQGLFALGIQFGHSFTGCAFWFGNIHLNNCTGIQIRNSQIVLSSITITGGGLNSIDDNWTRDPIVPTLVGFTFTSFRRNRTTAADTSPQSFYGDQYMIGQASTFGFPIAWNVTVDTELPITYATKRWHGVDAGFLQSGGRAYIARSGIYSISAALVFTTLGVSQGVSLKIMRFSVGSVLQETIVEYNDFPASIVGCTVGKNIDMMCVSGDTISIQVRTSTATGVSITAIDCRVRSVD